MKTIKLTRNKETIVDNKDYKELSKFKWYCTKAGYAQHDFYFNKKNIPKLIHRFIMKPKDGEIIDHINGNKLDNRRSNLRICTQSENSKNIHGNRKNNTSGLKGVSWNKKYEKWESYITCNYKRKFIGYFNKKEEAAKAYNKKAIELFGNFSSINII